MRVIELNEVYKPKKNYTVIVKTITFNHSKYIEDTLNGIAMQNTNFPFVNIVLEDNSTDGEQEVIRIWLDRECDMSLAEYYDIPTAVLIIAPHKENINCTFAIYFHKKNLFQQKNIRESQVNPWRYNSKYEALCEGDDYWIDPLKLQKQVDFLDANPEYGMCYTKARVYNQERKNNERIYGGPYTDFNHIINVNPIPTLTVVAKTDLILQYNQEIEPQKQRWLMGDYPMWLWFAYNSKIKFIDAATGVYRVLKNSASHSSEYMKFIAFTQSGIDIQAFYKFLYTGKYTHRQYCTDLWLAELRGYAIYNKRLKFMSIWENGIKQDAYRLFVIKPYLYIIYFFCAKLRNDKL